MTKKYIRYFIIEIDYNTLYNNGEIINNHKDGYLPIRGVLNENR